MAETTLVSDAQALTKHLDSTEIKPRVVMWVDQADSGGERLWIVPKSDNMDKRDFYRILAKAIRRANINSISIDMVDLLSGLSPEIILLKHFVAIDGVGSARIANNTLDGVPLPNGTVIRMAV